MSKYTSLEEYEAYWQDQAVGFQPWIPLSAADREEQAIIQGVLARRSNARFGAACYVAPEARVFTNALTLGDRSFIASGSILRGSIKLGADCSVNPYCHLAGAIEIGNGVRIAGHVSIYGFNHGFSRVDVAIKDQAITSIGVVVEDNVWIGCNAVILDGVRIGANSIVAAGAVVTKNFPPFSVIGGNPAKHIRDRRESQAPSAVEVRPNGKVARMLYSADPYQDLHWTMAPDLQGWGSYEPIFEETILRVRPSLIVEVGTWKGASALHMAKTCKAHSIPVEIVCVDTWLGNWQHWSRESGVGSKQDLRLVNGFPTLYYQFMSNVISKGYQDTITPLPLTGVAAAKLFSHYGLRADLVYIDGDHEYEAVIGDLNGWLPLLSERGVLIGDDYSFPGVARAVKEIEATGIWNPVVQGNKFFLSKVAKS